jgi:hypothetical protein
VRPLTLDALKRAYPENHRFHDLIDLAFRSNEELIRYDDFHHEYRIARLLRATLPWESRDAWRSARCPHSLRFTELHMLHYRTMLNLVAIAALVSSPVIAQQPGMMQGTQQQHMQQHMTQMQDMMGRMSDMSQRSQQMQQQMKQQMGQMQGGQMGAAQMAMPQMADHMSAMTTQMKGLMGQMQTMMKDPVMMKDRAVQHDMDDMQDHMAAMSKDMGKMLQTMEQVQKHMGTVPAQPKKP